MNRRHFLTLAAGATAAGALGGCYTLPSGGSRGRVMTVRGPVEPDLLGMTLPHEHLLVDFTPVADLGARRYDPVAVVDRMLPYLLEIKDRGVQTLVDATPAYLGRDPLVLRALSDRSGLHILTNTGYYGARDDAHVPHHAYSDTPEELAARWVGEWRNGVGRSNVRPGFMKIGVDPGPLSEMDTKLITAAGIAHLNSGLTIAAHTGPAEPAFEQLEILRELGVHPSAWIWVHAQAEEDLDRHVDAARRGAWVEFDGVSTNSLDRHVALLSNMKAHGLLSRVLVSQDAGWYTPGEVNGGEVRGFTALSDELLPALREAGFSDVEIDRLTRVNPTDAFRVRIRRQH